MSALSVFELGGGPSDELAGTSFSAGLKAVAPELFSGVIGGHNSQLAGIALAFDYDNYVVADWIAMTSPQLGTVEQSFGYDESGRPIKISLGKISTITRPQAVQAIQNGSVLLLSPQYKVYKGIASDSFSVFDSARGVVAFSIISSDHVNISDVVSRVTKVQIFLSEIVTVSDSVAGLRTRFTSDSFAISDSVAASRAYPRHSAESIVISDSAIRNTMTLAGRTASDSTSVSDANIDVLAHAVTPAQPGLITTQPGSLVELAMI